MTDRVVIEGAELDVTVERADQAPDPKRRRPQPYVPSSPGGVDLLATISDCALRNPFWSDEANADADANPAGLRPKDLAHKWRRHRVQPQEAA